MVHIWRNNLVYLDCCSLHWVIAFRCGQGLVWYVILLKILCGCSPVVNFMLSIWTSVFLLCWLSIIFIILQVEGLCWCNSVGSAYLYPYIPTTVVVVSFVSFIRAWCLWIDRLISLKLNIKMQLPIYICSLGSVDLGRLVAFSIEKVKTTC